ncbi:hypothetical protein [Crenobacter cavernae]|uniref:DNA polymerase III subunit beta family protein n=1 Tax=Crenobacter cavernae TaxID=2290923 RepID=UPI003CCC4763
MPQTALKRMLAMVQYAMGTDVVGPREVLNGLLMVVDSRELRVIATDGHRLAMATHPVSAQEAISQKIVLARNTVVELMELLAQRDTPVAIDISPRQVRFRVDGRSSASEPVDREFPDYQSFISSHRANVMRINRQALAQALKRTSRDEPCGVQWVLNENSLVLSRADANPRERKKSCQSSTTGPPCASASMPGICSMR